ncbi:glycosyltransferase 87 family protein [Nocardia sp. NPDC005745]|uniref:glycosyltransferase 87 family protein n=1 Tax=Nocardia sp. NPDC005745 TaxID=3157061 RepID=UPI0033C623AF
MATVAPATTVVVAPATELPVARSPRPRTRPALGAAIVFTAASLTLWLLFLRPNWEMYWHQIDLQVYMWGGNAAALHPAQLYTARGPLFLPFLYPVFAAWICAELARFPINYVGTGMVVATLIALYAGVWCTAVLLRYRRGLGMLAVTLAVGSAALWLEPVQQTFRFGQISMILMAMVLGDFTIPKEHWSRGILIGIATGIKLTPAVFIVYLVVTRQIKAAAIAMGAFAATVAAGFWYRPTEAAQFWTTTVASQNRIGFAYVQNQSLNGLLGRLQWTTWDSHVLWLLGAGALGLAGLAAARIAHARGDEMLGILLAAGVTLLCSPISWTHYWVWMVPALVWAGHALSRRSRAGAIAVPAAIMLFAFAWPMQVDSIGAWDETLPLLPQGLIWFVPQTNGREFHWDIVQFLDGNSYALLTLAALVTAIVLLSRTPRPVLEPSRPARSRAPVQREACKAA